jgi:hypothetical protein
MYILSSCNNHSIIKGENIRSIRVTKDWNPFKKQDEKDISTITNADSIKRIINIINSSKPAVVKFLANYQIEVNYPDTTIFILCKNNSISVAGHAYKSSEEIEAIFKKQ